MFLKRFEVEINEYGFIQKVRPVDEFVEPCVYAEERVEPVREPIAPFWKLWGLVLCVLVLFLLMVCAGSIELPIHHQVDDPVPVAQPDLTSVDNTADYSAYSLVKLEPIVETPSTPAPTPHPTPEPVLVVPTYSTVDSFDLREPTGFSADELNSVLEGTGLEGLGEYYYQAEQADGVNAVFLIGLSALESGWGTTNLAKNKNNLFGFCAYDDNISAASTFDSMGECIVFVSSAIKRDYLTDGGRYNVGFTLPDLNRFYASDKSWAEKIGWIMCDVYEQLV